MTLCGTPCGFDDGRSSEGFADENEVWLRQLLPLASGIPSHGTSGNAMERIETRCFRQGRRTLDGRRSARSRELLL